MVRALPTSRDTHSSSPTIARLKARKAARRKREIALLVLAFGLAVAALVFDQPVLVLISVFPALASYGQR